MSFLPSVEEFGVAAYSAYVQHVTQVRSYLLVSQLYGKQASSFVLPLMVVSRYYINDRPSVKLCVVYRASSFGIQPQFIRLITMFFSLCPGSAERPKTNSIEFMQDTQLILLTTTTEALSVFSVEQ